MAIEFAGTSQAFGNSDASPSIALTVPADCTLVLVCIGWYSPDAVPSSMAINSVAMTKEAAYEGWNVGDVQIWRLANPSTGSQNLTWSWPQSPSLGAVLHVVYLKGVSASSPVRDSDYVSTGGESLQIILTTQSGDRVIGFVVDSDAPDASPTGSGQTDILNSGPFNTAYAASAYEDATGASVTFTSSGPGGYHVLIGVALIPATGDTVLTVSEGSHAHSSDAIALTQVHTLVVSECSHSQACDAPVLIEHKTLAAQDGAHAQLADSPVLSQQHTLAVAGADHAHGVDAPVLTQVHTLVPSESLHTQTTDMPALTQAHVLAISEGTHAHTVDNVVLDVSVTLEVAEAAHAHVVDSPVLAQIHTLAVAEAAHAHAVDGAVLAQQHILVVSESVHVHTCDGVLLNVFLVVADATHAHEADNIVLQTGGAGTVYGRLTLAIGIGI